jgi:ubiquinone/menaquinone biosynthesis C-methylase UbiE
LFSSNFSKKHIDIGVGTGYYPTKALSDTKRQPEDQHLILVDLSQNSLKRASQRVASKYPAVEIRCVNANATQPLPDPLQSGQFDSASLFCILHQIPGPASSKGVVIRNAKELLSDNGVLLGCTILGKQWEKQDHGYQVKSERPSGLLARYLLGVYNNKGWFNNWEDDPNVMDRVLRTEFEEVETKVVGVMFVFRAAKPRRE